MPDSNVEAMPSDVLMSIIGELCNRHPEAMRHIAVSLVSILEHGWGELSIVARNRQLTCIQPSFLIKITP